MRLPTKRLLTAIPLLPTLPSLTHADTKCKSIPGGPNWPTPAEWAAFNASLGGALIQPPPPGAVCHAEQPSYDAALCESVTAQWTTSFRFHEDDPLSSAFNNWNNDTCLPQPATAPCSAAGYPAYVVNATTPAHVQQAVRFAARHAVRLNVKCSGHDYLGRSVAPHALSVWTHHLRGIVVHDDAAAAAAAAAAFTPGQPRCLPAGMDAAPPAGAITFGAGEDNGAVYAAAAASGRGMAVPVTGTPTACYGGYGTGGGHSVLGARHGLVADLILSLKVVLADGTLVEADACSHADLFWALRGGGGATFGIVVEFTLALYPDEPTAFVLTSFAPRVDPAPDFYAAAAYASGRWPEIMDAGWAGYGSITMGNGTAPGSGSGSAFNMAWFGLGRQTEEMISFVASIGAHMNETWPGEFALTLTTAEYPSLYAWWANNTDTGSPVGVDIVVGSRLLGKEALNSPQFAVALEGILTRGGGLAMNNLGGPGVHNKPRGLNSVSPSWRMAYSHSITGVGWAPFDEAAKKQQLQLLEERMEIFRELAPGAGAYVNEADPFEENYHEIFWGENYPRLLAIKEDVDPDDVFWCRACVGNEGWEEVGYRLCRV